MYTALKTLIDYTLAIFGLILLSPLLIIVAILIKLESKGPIFYLQERVGKNRKLFKIFKFRSMLVDSDKIQLTSNSHASRITKIGSFIRKSHLDEVVQLINVLLGEMSIVGPRPEVQKYVTSSKAWDEILSMKPGITGISAVKYSKYEYNIMKNAEDPNSLYLNKILPKKMNLDRYYIRKSSFALDIKILFDTIKVIFL
jgi:lipopolysaccharide/colanic/teichoic acid biosynthesis glycosyltransferase